MLGCLWPALGLSISRSTAIDLLSWRAALERWCAATQHAMRQAHLTAASWHTDELKELLPRRTRDVQSRRIIGRAPCTRSRLTTHSLSCCLMQQDININHGFALWFTARKLRPPVVIESGVYHGLGTWLIRHFAGPDAHIINLDPSPRSQRART